MSMMITVTSTKGGVGKTAITIALAVEAVLGRRKARVIVFDADPQASLLTWADEVRQGHIMVGNAAAPPPLYLDEAPEQGPMLLVLPFKGTESMRGLAVVANADLILVDCKISSEASDPQRGRNAMVAADLVLVPVVPAQIDLLSLDHCRNLLATIPGLRLVHVLSRAHKKYVEVGRATLIGGGLRVMKTVIRERRDLARFTEASGDGAIRQAKGSAGTEVRSLLRELEAAYRGQKPTTSDLNTALPADAGRAP